MNTLGEVSSRTLKTISTLELAFQRKAKQWLEEMIQTGILPLVYTGFRSMEEQAALYAIGRSKPGKIVTKARPGESYHNYGMAFDWVPMKPAARVDLFQADWNDETAFKLGERVGITFGLNAISWETGHLQDGRYASWRDIPQSKESPGTKIAEKNRQAMQSRKVGIRKP
jgi:peptidoglycan L-alanyl-D-glutamate endopeptidase CwlK